MKRYKKYIIPFTFALFLVAINFFHDVLHQLKIEKKEKILENKQYMECLYIDADCEYKMKTIKVENKSITDLNWLYIDVAFYNYVKNEKICVEELLEEYENFCNNIGNWKKLEEFYIFDNGRGMPDYEHVKERDDYVYSITKYIRDNYGVSIEDAKIEQVEEAILVEAFVREKYNLLLFEANAQQVEEALLNVKE